LEHTSEKEWGTQTNYRAWLVEMAQESLALLEFHLVD
jgi:hypothetical protein